MKNLLLSLLASSTLIGLQAAPVNSGSFGELPVARIAAKVNAHGDTVTAGTSRVLVGLRLGAPTYVLSDGSWLYSNYVVHVTAGDDGRPATLVIRFTANRVSALTLADQSVVVALRETPHHPAADHFLAVASSRR